MKRLYPNILLSLSILGFIGVLTWAYASSLAEVNPTAIQYLETLKTETIAQGYRPNFYVVSGKRAKFHNQLLARFGGAASDSRHLKGEAIDIIVLDINSDGNINSEDVDIIYKILDTQIIKNKGGLGSYKNDATRFNQQMIHFDCRGYRARW